MRTVQMAIFPLILALGTPVWGQSGNSIPLGLTVKPIKKSFCRGDQEVAFLRVQVELQFTNETKNQTVSINKGDLHVDYIQVAKEAKDFSTTSRNYELSISSTSVLDSSANLDQLNPKLFLTLGPGESSTLESSFSIPVSVQNGTIEGTLPPGNHYVVIGVSGWLGSNELAKQVQTRLSQIGKLWTSAIRSRPIELVVESPSVIQVCN
jgi:hypothetical protein